jgi:hypothetical protein
MAPAKGGKHLEMMAQAGTELCPRRCRRSPDLLKIWIGIAEVFPAIWSRTFTREGCTGEQHDAFEAGNA